MAEVQKHLPLVPGSRTYWRYIFTLLDSCTGFNHFKSFKTQHPSIRYDPSDISFPKLLLLWWVSPTWLGWCVPSFLRSCIWRAGTITMPSLEPCCLSSALYRLSGGSFATTSGGWAVTTKMSWVLSLDTAFSNMVGACWDVLPLTYKPERWYRCYYKVVRDMLILYGFFDLSLFQVLISLVLCSFNNIP